MATEISNQSPRLNPSIPEESGSLEEHLVSDETATVKDLIKNKNERANKIILIASMVVGAVIGLLIGFFLNPLAGILLGAAAWFLLSNVLPPIVERLIERYSSEQPQPIQETNSVTE